MKVGTGPYTYELEENFAKMPEGETIGLISRVTTDSQNRLYIFQRKDPAVLIFDKDGKFVSSWGAGLFKRAHGFKIVNDVVYLTDQTDNVALIYTLDGKLIKQLGTRGQHSDTGCEDWHILPVRAAGPFNHPTEMMPGPSGDLYVTDGYRNSRVHRFTADGKLVKRSVKTGRRDEIAKRVEILSGLDPADTVLAARFDNLREGTPAKVGGATVPASAPAIVKPARGQTS